jgi:hypothetical protein
MTLEQALCEAYGWAVTHRQWLLVLALAIPAAGTLLARIGKAGQTEADGRLIASVVVGLGLLLVALELVGVALAVGALGANLLDADAVLLLLPIACMVGCLLGIRLVFPLNQLASIRTCGDIGLFVLACLAVIWFFSKFRGWGIYFFGSVGQLIVILVLGFFLLRRLYRRAFDR